MSQIDEIETVPEGVSTVPPQDEKPQKAQRRRKQRRFRKAEYSSDDDSSSDDESSSDEQPKKVRRRKAHEMANEAFENGFMEGMKHMQMDYMNQPQYYNPWGMQYPHDYSGMEPQMPFERKHKRRHDKPSRDDAPPRRGNKKHHGIPPRPCPMQPPCGRPYPMGPPGMPHHAFPMGPPHMGHCPMGPPQHCMGQGRPCPHRGERRGHKGHRHGGQPMPYPFQPW